MKTAIEILKKHQYPIYRDGDLKPYYGDSIYISKAAEAMEEYASQFKPEWVKIVRRDFKAVPAAYYFNVISINPFKVECVTGIYLNWNYMDFAYYLPISDLPTPQ